MRHARILLSSLFFLLAGNAGALACNAGSSGVMSIDAKRLGPSSRPSASLGTTLAGEGACVPGIAALKDDWVQVRSKNFNLIGNASEKDIRRIGTKLEQFRETFRLLFINANLTASVPTNVVVFKSNAAYGPFKPKRADGTTDTEVSGYFQSGEDANYITLSIDGSEKDLLGTIFHEYVHFVIQTNFGPSEAPQWLNEGLAEYYQTFEIAGDVKVKLGLPPVGHIALLQQNPLMPIEQLLNFTNFQLHQTSGKARNLFYAQSWALVHYLLQSGRSEALDSFLRAVTSGSEPKTAFQAAFQTTYDKLDGELRGYVLRNSYNFQEVTLKTKLTFDAEMISSPLDDATTNAYLGDLLYHLRRPEDAVPFLLTAIKLKPDSSLANASLGMLRLSQRKFDAARFYLEKAIASDPRNHLTLFRYADLLGRDARDEYGYVSRIEPATAAKMRDALKKAIAADPSFTDSYELLAFISLVNNDELDAAIGYLQTALKYRPDKQKYSLRIAEILTRQNKFDEAAQTAEKIARTAVDADTKSRADSLLVQIADLKRSAERQEAERKRKEALIANSGGIPIEVKRIDSTRPPTEEETAKQNEHLRMRALNEILRKPAAGEQRVRGSVQRVDCRRRPLAFTIKTATETFTVTSKDFEPLFLRAHDPAAIKVAVGCDANLSSFTALVTFRGVAGTRNAVRGELVALEFIPPDFRFMTDEEMRTATLIIYDQPAAPKPGGTPEIITIGSIAEDIEARRKVIIAREITNALRKPLDGEKREMGFLERIECADRNTFFHLRTSSISMKLTSMSLQSLRVYIYAPDLGNTPLNCTTKAIDFPVVFTFRDKPNEKDKTAGEILSLEFVPKSFVLDQ